MIKNKCNQVFLNKNAKKTKKKVVPSCHTSDDRVIMK